MMTCVHGGDDCFFAIPVNFKKTSTSATLPLVAQRLPTSLIPPYQECYEFLEWGYTSKLSGDVRVFGVGYIRE